MPDIRKRAKAEASNVFLWGLCDTRIHFGYRCRARNDGGAGIRIENRCWAGWDGAVTGAGLCGAIGSEFAGLTHGTKNEVAALINANVAPVEIGVIIVAFLCLILLVKIRSAKTIGPLKATFALIIGGVALGVPGYQAWLIALSLVPGTP